MKKLAHGIQLFSFYKHTECLSIVKNDLNELFKPGSIVKKDIEQNDYYPGVDEEIRKTDIFGLANSAQCHKDDPLVKLKNILDDEIGKLFKTYRGMNGLDDLISFYDWIVMRYEKGSFFKNHKDDGPMFDRTVSVIVYLNDDFVGGEIEFPGFNVLHKPRAGDVLFFPSSYVYNHNIKEVTEGTRYAVVNWFSYPDRLK
jgi:hypothetical protein